MSRLWSHKGQWCLFQISEGYLLLCFYPRQNICYVQKAWGSAGSCRQTDSQERMNTGLNGFFSGHLSRFLQVFTEGLKRDLKMPLKLFVWASQLKLLYSKTAARHLILPCSQIAAFPERGKTVQSCECCCSKNVNITLSYWLYEVTAKWNAIKRWLHLGGF